VVPPLVFIFIAGVERHRGRIVYLTYEPSTGFVDKTLFLVGKGVTYDTGGADIKAGGVMAGMSRDKCGAAAVAGFMQVHAVYFSPCIIQMITSRRMGLAGRVVCMGGKGNACRVLMGKHEGKRPLGRPRHSWEDNIEMGLKEMGREDMDSIYVAWDRGMGQAIVNTVMNTWVP
jgi:hypothetical protein